jgi:hypothetical protein
VELCQTIGHRRRPDPLQLEHLRVTILDRHRCPGQRCQFCQGVPQLPAGHAGDQVDQVDQRLAFDRRDQPLVDQQIVVATGQSPLHRGDLLGVDTAQAMIDRHRRLATMK